MNPDQDPYNGLTFAQYLWRMGEKFSPVAESMQMEAEYKARKQGKMEDVQNYIKASTKGLLNRYVRDQMFCFKAESMEAYGARAVWMVQVERGRVKIGDSE